MLNLPTARIGLVANSKRPLAPAATALLVFISVPLVVALGGLLTKSNMVTMERGIQGAGTLGFILAIISYFLGRQRMKKWETAQRAADVAENRKVNASRPRCLRCGLVITGSEQPWQKDSFCSEKCRALGAPS
jgi:hypothetical protein